MENQDREDKMTTLSQVMTTLSQRGIHREYRMSDEGNMRLDNDQTIYQPEDLTILRTYRFEGDSNPADNAVLYVVKDHHANIGFISDSDGAESNYSGDQFDQFLRDIPVEESDEYNIE